MVPWVSLAIKTNPQREQGPRVQTARNAKRLHYKKRGFNPGAHSEAQMSRVLNCCPWIWLLIGDSSGALIQVSLYFKLKFNLPNTFSR